MPIYEFQCRSCGHVWDRLQRMSDPDPETCPECQAAEVGRRMTAASFRLKGAGWYETDFKGEKDKKRNLVEGSSGGDSAPPPAESKSSDSTGKTEGSPVPAPAPAAAPPSAPST